MSWIEELSITYDKRINQPEDSTKHKNGSIKPLLPLYHQLQNSTLEIIIDSQGQYLGARRIEDKNEQKIIVPCTEASAARTTNNAAHPLCDKVQYCSKDYQSQIESWLNTIQKLGISRERIVKDYLKNKNKSYYNSYCEQQQSWLKSSLEIPSLKAISLFVKGNELIQTLIKEGIVKEPLLAAFEMTFNETDFEKLQENNQSFYSIISEEIQLYGYEINSDLKNKIFSNKKKEIAKENKKNAFNYAVNLVESISAIADLLVRWKVEIPQKLETRCWKDKELMDSWVSFCSLNEKPGEICFVTGTRKPIARTHPKGIIDTVTNAKLISANDSEGFTFRGRFLEANQACAVSTEISHKAHSALKWLISRQGYQNGTQAIISWAVSGEQTPDIFADSLSVFDETDEEKIKEISTTLYTDNGQTFARKLSRKIAGYHAELKDASKIVVMGLDSAGPGRISITFYRELSGSDFLGRIEKWHMQMAWHFLNFVQDPNDKKKRYHGYFASAPAPSSIAEACYGTKRDKDFIKFKKSIVERLLPCIIDGKHLPIDIMELAVRKASNRLGFKEDEHWQWERTLSVACALYRCYSNRNLNNKNQLTMALEHERTDRDYLYGRLLATAEHLEEYALYLAKENRITNAARLMQRFSDQPFQTWLYIEKSLDPYKTSLQAKRPQKLFFLKNLMGEIHNKFQPGEYEKEGRLTGLYLLGYHCQRLELVPKGDKIEKESEKENNQ